MAKPRRMRSHKSPGAASCITPMREASAAEMGVSGPIGNTGGTRGATSLDCTAPVAVGFVSAPGIALGCALAVAGWAGLDAVVGVLAQPASPAASAMNSQ